MLVSITSVRSRGDGEVAVTFKISEGENSSFDTFLVSVSAVRELKLAVGDSTREMYDEVAYRDKIYSACKKSAYILGYGACSKKKLIQKLRTKGVEQEIAEEAAEEMAKRGYLDDLASAEREAERAAAKKWGARRIYAALYQKGYDEEAIKSAIYALEDAGVDFVANCADLIRSRYGELPMHTSPDERRKLYAALSRYGYSSSEINSAIEMLNEE